jgi:hypothetical protein
VSGFQPAEALVLDAEVHGIARLPDPINIHDPVSSLPGESLHLAKNRNYVSFDQAYPGFFNIQPFAAP